MELFFLCTALSLHVLDHCMKLYWKRKTQRTAGPTDRPPARPTDHRVTPIYPPKLRFGGIIKHTQLKFKTANTQYTLSLSVLPNSTNTLYVSMVGTLLYKAFIY